jgi:hypothetical protein
MQIILYKKNSTGPACYYSIDDRQQNLFYPYTLTVHWGKTPDGGRQKSYILTSLAAKNALIRSILTKKLRTYQVLYSFFQQAQAELRTTAQDIIDQTGRRRA